MTPTPWCAAEQCGTRGVSNGVGLGIGLLCRPVIKHYGGYCTKGEQFTMTIFTATETATAPFGDDTKCNGWCRSYSG